jgi:hypothetical protein
MKALKEHREETEAAVLFAGNYRIFLHFYITFILRDLESS